MPFPARLAIASKNPHKLRELGRICRDWPVEWLTVANHPGPWPDVAEPHDTYLDNALEKARAIAATLGEPAIADDSGIEVDALDGAPGPRSARFAGEGASDAENLAKLIEVVVASPPEARTARYRCVAAIAWPDGRTLHAEGTCDGHPRRRRPGGRAGSATTRSSCPKARTARWPSSPTRRRTGSATAGRAFRTLAGLLSG